MTSIKHSGTMLKTLYAKTTAKLSKLFPTSMFSYLLAMNFGFMLYISLTWTLSSCWCERTPALIQVSPGIHYVDVFCDGLDSLLSPTGYLRIEVLTWQHPVFLVCTFFFLQRSFAQCCFMFFTAMISYYRFWKF